MTAFETLRVFRPRMLVYGDAGMGQGYVGAAVLHHLEGFHVQTLDLATLVSDSSRTMEAACVQLFVEAKRHKPSILFVPSLVTWCASVTDTVRSTIKGLLDGLDPSDPILLLAVVDGPLSDVPPDVRSWFGFVKGNRVNLGSPRVVSSSPASLCPSWADLASDRNNARRSSGTSYSASSARRASTPTRCRAASVSSRSSR